MARPSRCRRVCMEPAYCGFIPNGETHTGITVLTVDEYEVVRLVDYEKRTHEQCAAQMEISRTTVTEIYESARFKLSDVLVKERHWSLRAGITASARGNGDTVVYGIVNGAKSGKRLRKKEC